MNNGIKNYYKLGEFVITKAEERLKIKDDLKAKETDRLFFWIMNQIFFKFYELTPAQKYIRIKLSATNIDSNKICVSHGKNNIYYLNSNLNQNEGLEILENVTNIINSFPYYDAECLSQENSDEIVILIALSIK